MSDSIWEDPKLTAYILDELSEDDRAVFEEMLQTDPKLADAVNEARGVTDQLQAMYAAEANTTLDPNRRESITRQQDTFALTPRSTPSWRVPVTVLATAAALLLLIGAPLLYKRSPSLLGEATESRSIATDNPSIEADSVLLEEANKPSMMQSEESAPMEAMADNADFDEPSMEIAEGSQDKLPGTRSEQSVRNEAQRMGVGGGTSAPATPAAPGTLRDATTNQPGVQSNVTHDPNPFPLEKELAKSFGAAPTPTGKRKQLQQKTAAEAMKAGESFPTTGAAGLGVSISQSASRGISPDFPADSLDRQRRALDDGESDQRNRFPALTENAFKRVEDSPLSTFSVDVDTASYSKVREYLLSQHQRPPVDAIRIEEMVNYFNYEYLPPEDDAPHPFAAKAEIMSCPWNDNHRLARIALKGKTMKPEDRPLSNLVFLLDTSGSMNSHNKLPLVKQGMQMLLSQLGENDRVAIAVYAGSAGLVLDSTPATKKRKIEKALSELAAGGSTNGGAGINLAYSIARDNFIPGGVNRVILCTDGDFNVGTTGTGSLVRMVEQQAAGGIFLSVLGFGMGNHNDAMLEQISGRGNGNYAFIDGKQEAEKVLVDQVNATLVTIAKDVKLQIEFNPRLVSAYRLIGYENRVLAKEDFNDDKKDAGEIGAGHAVTALYELVPAGSEGSLPPEVDPLKYQNNPELTDAANGGESLTLKLRYKEPDGDTSKLVEFPVIDNETNFKDADHDARFAAAVAGFGMQLRNSKYAGDWQLNDVITVAEDAKGEDESGLRAQFVEMAQTAKKILGQE